jgi:hypothetical protein
MAQGLDGRHRDENGQIHRKRGDTLMSTLQHNYPELREFSGSSELSDVLRSQRVESLSELLRKVRG